MKADKKDILNKLKAQVLELQGFKPAASNMAINFGLGAIENCFPAKTFPTGTVHEFLADDPEGAAASEGFIAGLLAKLMENGSSCLWISQNRKLFPPALETFGADPQQIIFIDLYYKKEVLWVMEEALKCEGLACVIAEVADIDFAQSRRLQLATERSHVTGFLLRKQPKFSLSATTCAARWQIRPYPSQLAGGIPGVGNPRWEVKLLKVKNGTGGSFQMEWSQNRFAPLARLPQEKIKIIQQRGLSA